MQSLNHWTTGLLFPVLVSIPSYLVISSLFFSPWFSFVSHFIFFNESVFRIIHWSFIAIPGQSENVFHFMKEKYVSSRTVRTLVLLHIFFFPSPYFKIMSLVVEDKEVFYSCFSFLSPESAWKPEVAKCYSLAQSFQSSTLDIVIWAVLYFGVCPVYWRTFSIFGTQYLSSPLFQHHNFKKCLLEVKTILVENICQAFN